MKWSWEGSVLVLRTTRISPRGAAGALIARIAPEGAQFGGCYKEAHGSAEFRRGTPAECLSALRAHVPNLPEQPDTSPWCTRIGGHLPLGCCCWTRTCDTDRVRGAL